MADWIRVGNAYIDLDKVSLVSDWTDDNGKSESRACPGATHSIATDNGDFFYIGPPETEAFVREMDARVLAARLLLRSQLSSWPADDLAKAKAGPMPPTRDAEEVAP